MGSGGAARRGIAHGSAFWWSGPAVEPGLEQHGGGGLSTTARRAFDRQPLLPQRLVGGDGGEALVVGLDRHRAARSASSLDLGQRALGRGPVVPSSDRGRPTTTTLGLAPRRPARRCTAVRLGARSLRCDDRRTGVASVPAGSLTATPMRRGAEVERQRPSRAGEPAAARAWSRASSRPRRVLAAGHGQRRVACPPPPLTALAASAISSPASRPLSVRRPRRRGRRRRPRARRRARRPGRRAGRARRRRGRAASSRLDAVDAGRRPRRRPPAPASVAGLAAGAPGAAQRLELVARAP